MGDMSKEPSMEEILSSIKRIIREEGDTSIAEPRAPRRGRMELVPPVEAEKVEEPVDVVEEEVLELTPPETETVTENAAAETVADEAFEEPVDTIETADVVALTPPDPIFEEEPAVETEEFEALAEEEPEALAVEETEAEAEEAAAPEEILELTDAVNTEATVGLTEALSKKSTDSMLSMESEVQMRHRLAALSSMVVVPEAGAPSNTLEGMVEGMLRPLIREWLDANLPDMVEGLVAKEIARLTGGIR